MVLSDRAWSPESNSRAKGKKGCVNRRSSKQVRQEPLLTFGKDGVDGSMPGYLRLAFKCFGDDFNVEIWDEMDSLPGQLSQQGLPSESVQSTNDTHESRHCHLLVLPWRHDEHAWPNHFGY